MYVLYLTMLYDMTRNTYSGFTLLNDYESRLCIYPWESRWLVPGTEGE